MRFEDSGAVIACVLNISCGADAHDWNLVASCFDASVLVDYVSLAGGAPVRLSPQQIVEAWQGLLPGYALTRHRLGNFRVEGGGDKARCRSYVDALHVIPGARGGDVLQIIGTYTHELERRGAEWKVSAIRFEKDYLWGNQALPELAQKRLSPRVIELEIPCGDDLLAGHLYVPGDWDENGALSAVLVCGSCFSVKEHMAGDYARAMAQMGFASLAFDHRGFGQSSGSPRLCEWPERKIDDCRAAFSFLQNRPEIDFERMFGLGLGAGAGYMLCAASGETRIRGLALAGSWLHTPEAQAAIYGGEAQIRRLLLEETEAGGVPALDNTAMEDEFAWLQAFNENAGEEDAAPWNGRSAALSWSKWFGFDPLAKAHEVAAPTLLVHSRSAFYPEGVEVCFQRLGGRKSLFWVEGGQRDFYASPALRTACVRRIADHFRRVF